MIEKKRAINLIELYGDQDSKYLKISRPKYPVVQKCGTNASKKIGSSAWSLEPTYIYILLPTFKGLSHFFKKIRKTLLISKVLHQDDTHTTFKEIPSLC